jgi:hypothetical protein
MAYRNGYGAAWPPCQGRLKRHAGAGCIIADRATAMAASIGTARSAKFIVWFGLSYADPFSVAFFWITYAAIHYVHALITWSLLRYE